MVKYFQYENGKEIFDSYTDGCYGCDFSRTRFFRVRFYRRELDFDPREHYAIGR